MITVIVAEKDDEHKKVCTIPCQQFYLSSSGYDDDQVLEFCFHISDIVVVLGSENVGTNIQTYGHFISWRRFRNATTTERRLHLLKVDIYKNECLEIFLVHIASQSLQWHTPRSKYINVNDNKSNKYYST